MALDKKRIIIIVLGILSIIIVFFAPYGYHIDIGPGLDNLMAIVWNISEYFGFQILESLEYVPYYFFRIVVLYEIFRFFQEKISRKRLVLMGIICELIPLLVSIPGVIFLNSEGENYIPIMISIPTLLIFDIILVQFFSSIKIEDGIEN
ncbi:MAG: hypothetical protein V3V33_11450 [Candidatus Lokiarchaeia archaeon]